MRNIKAYLVITLSSSSPNSPPIKTGSSTNITSDVVIGGKTEVEGDFFFGGGLGSLETEGVFRFLRFLGLLLFSKKFKTKIVIGRISVVFSSFFCCFLMSKYLQNSKNL